MTDDASGAGDDVRVAVISVSHHMADDVVAAVAALNVAEPDLAREVIVVDNASGPAELEQLRAIGGVRVIANPRNIGFGRACNQAVEATDAPWLLFTNPDVSVRHGAIRRLLEAARADPTAAILAPRLVYPDGTLQLSSRSFYTWLAILLRRTPLGRILPRSRTVRTHLMSDWDHLDTRAVDWVIGACWLMRRDDFIQLGGFDPRFFLYFEDVDLCLRAWRSGRAVQLVGSAECVHQHRRQSAGAGPSWAKLWHVRSMWRFYRKHHGWPERPRPDGTERSPRRAIVFVNDGDGAMAVRAQRFADVLAGDVVAKSLGGERGRVVAVARAVATIVCRRPRLVHVIDVGVAGLLVQIAARVVGACVLLDTGDEHYELMRRTDRYHGSSWSGLKLELSGVVERCCLSLADRRIVRGRGHIVALRGRGYNDVFWLPDGVDAAHYADAARHPWRSDRGWCDQLVVASVGSLGVDHRYRSTQGLELIRALPFAPRVRAAIVGDGPGRVILEREAHRLGVHERVAMLGWRPPTELPSLVKSFDVCLSTQTDDAVGHARTTGKLPLFLAAGRFVLASRVGEASRVLPESMLVDYHGENDVDYPERLGRRIAQLDADRRQLNDGAVLVQVARDLFDYVNLAPRLRAIASKASIAEEG